MIKTILRTLPELHQLPTAANKINKNIIILSQETHAVMMECQQNCSKVTHSILVFL